MKHTLTFLTVCLLVPFSAGAQDCSLVVYNTDLGLVRKAVDLNLAKGSQTVLFTDAADRIDPTSVRLEAVDGGVRLIEQSFRFGFVNSQRILDEYIDHAISVWIKGGDLIQGTLLSAAGDIVVRDASGKVNIIRADSAERIEFSELPEGMVNRPTLFWLLDSDRAGKTRMRVSYLTGGLTWHAEYGAVVNAAETEIDLSALVSIENNSGESFRDAQVKLVAGDIHRVPAPRRVSRFGMEKMVMAAPVPDQAGGFEERSLSEYHLYNLKGTTTVDNAGIQQLSLFSPVRTKVKREFVCDSMKNPENVMVNIEFLNTEKDGPGIPLPGGKVRVYRRDTDGSLVLVGEDAIGHTPKNDRVRLAIGNAFDLKSERKIMDTRSISSRVNEQDVEIAFRNRKTEPVTITVVEHLNGDWEITNKSHDFVKKDANTAEFTVKVPANGETTVTYTVRNRF